MASKRARTINAADVSEYIEVRVHVLNKEAPDIVLASSGRGFRPKHLIQPVQFKRTGGHKFWRLWIRFRDYMLYKKGENEPYMDFEAPIDQIEATDFIAMPWKSGYERQRQHLVMLDYKHQHKQMEREAAEQETKLNDLREHMKVLAERIAHIEGQLAAPDSTEKN